MRRKDREVCDVDEMVRIIETCDSCVVALNDEGFPYMVPLNFGMKREEGQIYLYFHCAAKGKKLDLIRKDNRASFEMDCGHRLILDEEGMNCTMGYASVLGHGTIETVPEEEKFDALTILMSQYHAEGFAFNTDMIKATTVLRLKVLDMTGKRRDDTR